MPAPGGQFQVDGGRWASRSVRIALGSTTALVALAARRIERSHPPMGNFIEVDGVRVHYVDVGEGEPVVLLHGNAACCKIRTSASSTGSLAGIG